MTLSMSAPVGVNRRTGELLGFREHIHELA